jgi:hypothetical protein
MKMICQRCTKDVSGDGVHTCTPSALVRKLEAKVVELTQQLAAAKDVPMKYKRMEFNAKLQEQLAAMTQERDNLMALTIVNENLPVPRLREQLAASQAREAALREVLEMVAVRIIEGHDFTREDQERIDNLLSIPSDTTALDRSNKRYAAGLFQEVSDLFAKFDKEDIYMDAEIAATSLGNKAEQLRNEAECRGHCMCDECKDGVIHDACCAVHNEPAYPKQPCDCGAKK